VPDPINHDPNNANDDSNVQDKGQRLHDFSGGVSIIMRPQDWNQTARL